jgi:peroxiredoxin
MADTELSPPLGPGDPAPDFALPAIDRDGTVSLADYRGRTPVLVALFRGVYCPFCRRAIAQLSLIQERLKAVGVETLAVVATPVERARLYFRYRPARVTLAADPGLTLHRAFRVPKPEATPKMMESLQTVRLKFPDLPEPMTLHDAANAMDEADRFEHTDSDTEDAARQFPQLVGQFLLDRSGIIRWANVEGASEGVSGLGKFPSAEEFVAAAKAAV